MTVHDHIHPKRRHVCATRQCHRRPPLLSGSAVGLRITGRFLVRDSHLYIAYPTSYTNIAALDSSSANRYPSFQKVWISDFRKLTP
jgi:hypothetical protein